MKLERQIKTHIRESDEPIEPVYPIESFVGPGLAAVKAAKFAFPLSKAEKAARAAAIGLGVIAGPDVADVANDKPNKLGRKPTKTGYKKGGAVRGHGCETRGKTRGKFK